MPRTRRESGRCLAGAGVRGAPGRSRRGFNHATGGTSTRGRSFERDRNLGGGRSFERDRSRRGRAATTGSRRGGFDHGNLGGELGTCRLGGVLHGGGRLRRLNLRHGRTLRPARSVRGRGRSRERGSRSGIHCLALGPARGLGRGRRIQDGAGTESASGAAGEGCSTARAGEADSAGAADSRRASSGPGLFLRCGWGGLWFHHRDCSLAFWCVADLPSLGHGPEHASPVELRPFHRPP